ncbi:unnamed protein product, partial [Meganyctiphanes norvegica]
AKPDQVKENLIDGIYGYNDSKECYCSDQVTGAWFVVDLGETRWVNGVRITAMNNSWAGQYFSNVEVRIGGSLVTTGDFSPYTLLGQFTGPATPGQEVLVQPVVPAEGRFIYVQRT